MKKGILTIRLNIFHCFCMFTCSYLDDTMIYLLGCLRRDRERSAAFQAIGLIAVAVQTDINRHLKTVMEVVRTSLPVKDASQR